MFQHAPRVTVAYSDVSGAISEWLDRAQMGIVCQHDADEKVNKTHIHLGMWGCDVKEEALKRMFNKKTQLKLSGNEDWKWKSKRFPDGLPPWEPPEKTPSGLIIPGKGWDQNFKYLTYCIKGDLSRVKMVKNISRDILEEASEAWEDFKAKFSPSGRTEVHIEHVKVRAPPYQQTVINETAIAWYDYKKQCRESNEDVDRTKVAEFVCNAMRKVSKGINPHMVRDLSYAVLYDDWDYRDFVLGKVMAFMK